MELVPFSLDDLAVVHGITLASERNDVIPYITTFGELRETFEHPDIDLASDARLVHLDGTPVGVGLVAHSPAGERLETALLAGWVHPDHRRRGVGSALLDWQIERGRRRLMGMAGDRPCFLRAFHYVSQQDAIELCVGRGMAPARWFDELIRPVDRTIDAPVPDDVVIVPWDDRRREEIRRARNSAFADHWGSTPRSPESFGHWLDGEGTRLDLSFVALRGGHVAGYTINSYFPDDDAVTGRRDGWIGNIGVLRRHRGRGVATALIAASVDAFRTVGLTHARLQVDTDSPSGAHELYRRLGFELSDTEVTHELEVTGP